MVKPETSTLSERNLGLEGQFAQQPHDQGPPERAAETGNDALNDAKKLHDPRRQAAICSLNAFAWSGLILPAGHLLVDRFLLHFDHLLFNGLLGQRHHKRRNGHQHHDQNRHQPVGDRRARRFQLVRTRRLARQKRSTTVQQANWKGAGPFPPGLMEAHFPCGCWLKLVGSQDIMSLGKRLENVKLRFACACNPKMSSPFVDRGSATAAAFPGPGRWNSQATHELQSCCGSQSRAPERLHPSSARSGRRRCVCRRDGLPGEGSSTVRPVRSGNVTQVWPIIRTRSLQLPAAPALPRAQHTMGLSRCLHPTNSSGVAVLNSNIS